MALAMTDDLIHRFCTVAQMREALDQLQPDDELMTNRIGNLSVFRMGTDVRTRGWRKGQTEFDQIGWIEMASEAVSEVSDVQPKADLVLVTL